MSVAELAERMARTVETSSGVRAIDGTIATDLGPHPWPAGTMLEGGYRLERVLGRGGFAVVYEAVHPELGVVAVKLLEPCVETDQADAAARFVREAQVAAMVEHPNVLDVHELGTAPDGSPFLVMELLMGEDLSDVIARKPLDVAAAVEIGIQLCGALGALERASVLHRDLKPHNVLMHREGGVVRPKLIDFGIAMDVGGGLAGAQKLTRTGVILGTPHYLSPEQARGDELDIRSDLYALGVVLYEAVCGRAPFESGSLSAIMASVLRDDRPSVTTFFPECPAGFAQILDKAIRRDPDERFQSPVELAEALAAFANEAGLERGDSALGSVELTSKMTLPWELRNLARCESPSPRSPRAPALAPTLPALRPAPERRMAKLVAAGALLFALPLAGLLHDGASAEAAAPADKRALAMVEPTDAEPSPVTDQEDAPPPEPEVEPEPAPEPSAEALERRAHQAYVRGRLERARGLYARATRSDPELADAWRGYGLVSARLGRSAEARRALNRYLRLAPGASDAGAVRETLASL